MRPPRAVPELLIGFCLGAMAVIAASPLIAVIVLALFLGASRLAIVISPMRRGEWPDPGTFADRDALRSRRPRAPDSRGSHKGKVFDGEEDLRESSSRPASRLVGRSTDICRRLVAGLWLNVPSARRTHR